MEVILLQKVANLGNIGDKVKVKPGYGRNFLLPSGKAALATATNLKKFEARRSELEKLAAESKLKTVKNWQELPSLEVRPPDIFRYFVRVKPDALDAFINQNKLQAMDREKAEDEFVYQNSLKLNGEYYASLGEKKAFVVSQGRNILVLKIVGYSEDVVRY